MTKPGLHPDSRPPRAGPPPEQAQPVGADRQELQTEGQLQGPDVPTLERRCGVRLLGQLLPSAEGQAPGDGQGQAGRTSTLALEKEGPAGDHLCRSLSWGLDPGSQGVGGATGAHAQNQTGGGPQLWQASARDTPHLRPARHLRSVRDEVAPFLRLL